MRIRRWSIVYSLWSVVSLTGCGSVAMPFDESVATQLAPVVTRVAPAVGKAGDTITIFGVGFSIEPPLNVILVGGATTTAATYGLVIPPTGSEVEQLTFTLPATSAVGATTIAVLVADRASNNTVAFTVTP